MKDGVQLVVIDEVGKSAMIISLTELVVNWSFLVLIVSANK